MNDRDLKTQARQMGARRVAALVQLPGVDEIVVQRWIAGAVNPDLADAFRRVMGV